MSLTRCVAAAASVVVVASAAPRSTSGTPQLDGRVLLADGGTPVGLRAYLRAGAIPDSADVASDGSFTLRLADVECDSVDVEIAAHLGTSRRYHSAYHRVRVAARPAVVDREVSGPPGPHPLPWDIAPPSRDSLRVVLIPTSFTIRGGVYAGTTVPISIDDVTGDGPQRSRFWRVSRAARGYGSPVAWADTTFPLTVAFEGRRDVRGPEAAAFWAIARRLEEDVGLRLFRPAPPLSATAEGSASLVVRFDAASHAAGTTFITYDNWGTLSHASIELRTPALLHDHRVVTHELLHALGVGHAPWWPSVMGAPQYTTTRATPVDIAYVQLLYAFRSVYLEGRATHGPADSMAPNVRAVPGPMTGCSAAERAASPSP